MSRTKKRKPNRVWSGKPPAKRDTRKSTKTDKRARVDDNPQPYQEGIQPRERSPLMPNGRAGTREDFAP